MHKKILSLDLDKIRILCYTLIAMERKKIIVKIVKSLEKGKNYDYIFIGEKRIYVENDIRRYLRIINYLLKKKLLCL